ncbi:MAG TPA: 30S ribosomal protein S20 [Candidatus Babeliales bacterium]|nr:30S ribosomal protein S20 [Candidatus Babeliales bacterium]
MANIKSAQKRSRQEVKRRSINLARTTALKTAVKKVLTAIENQVEPAKVKVLMQAAEAQLARAKRKVLHANAASRKISGLARRVSSYVRATVTK